MKKHSRAGGFLYAALAGVFWGITGPLGQYLFNNKGVVPEWLVPYRLLMAGAFILLWIRGKKGKYVWSIWKNKKDACLLVIYSVAGMMAVQYSFFAAVKASNGGTATVLQYLSPVMMIVFFAVAKQIMPSNNEIVAVIAALAGIFFLSTNGNIHTLVITPRGLFLGLVCAFFTCVYSMLPKGLLERYNAQMVCGWAMFLGGIVLTVWKRPWTLGVQADKEIWGLLILLVFVGTILPFTFSLDGIRRIGPVYTNLLSSIEPVMAAIVTWAVLGTKFGKVEVLGFVCIIVTVFILAIPEFRDRICINHMQKQEKRGSKMDDKKVNFEEMDYEEMTKWADEKVKSHGLTRNLGIRIRECRDSYCRGEIELDERHENPYGWVHGGCMFSLADTVAGIAASTESKGGQVTTLNCDFHYLRAGRNTTKLVCTAECVRNGNTILVYDTKICNAEGELLSKGSYTFFNLHKKD